MGHPFPRGGVAPVFVFVPDPPARKTSTRLLLAGMRSGTPSTSRTPSSCTTNSRRITPTSSVRLHPSPLLSPKVGALRVFLFLSISPRLASRAYSPSIVIFIRSLRCFRKPDGACCFSYYCCRRRRSRTPPLFPAFIIQCYGSVLSPLPEEEEQQGNLSRALGSVVAIACLRTEGRVGPQLTSHVYGLLKARAAQGLSEEDRWLASDEGTEWVIRTVDTLLDVVIAERG